MESWITLVSGSHEYLLRLLLAALMGGLVGLERQLRGRSAGLRTNILVCVGSAAMIVAFQKLYLQGEFGSASAIRMDPARAAAGVITGIGFIGAGTIIKSRDFVRGLTTAASIWVVATIGITLGLGDYAIASALTLIVLITLYLLHLIKLPADRYGTLAVSTAFLGQAPDDIQLEELGMTPKHRVVVMDRGADLRTERISVRYRDEGAPAKALAQLAEDAAHLRLEWH